MAGHKRKGYGGVGKRHSSSLPLIALASVLVLWGVAITRVEGQSSVTPTNETSYTPTTSVWINCGGQAALISDLGNFQADNIPNVVSGGILATNIANSIRKSDPYPQLLEDARIFYNTSSYKIPVARPGGVWLRLWFYPITFVQGHKTYTPSSALFSVTANGFTLLENLTAETIQAGPKKYMYVEYLINVQHSLTITFQPEPNSIALVNGLAVVSVPDNLLESTIYLVAASSSIKLNMAANAVQTMYRLNVGGQFVTPGNDPFLTRVWEPDFPYIYGAIIGEAVVPVPSDQIIYPNDVPVWTAPGSVYGTARVLGGWGSTNALANLTWTFNVDPGYAYYVRLHFDELIYVVVNQRVFNIYLNNETAYANFDPIALAGENLVASFLDFLVDMFNSTSDQLWVALSPSTGNSQYKDVILNGLEIFKINSTNASF